MSGPGDHRVLLVPAAGGKKPLLITVLITVKCMPAPGLCLMGAIRGRQEHVGLLMSRHDGLTVETDMFLVFNQNKMRSSTNH
jgi:hypothetical protein